MLPFLYTASKHIVRILQGWLVTVCAILNIKVNFFERQRFMLLKYEDGYKEHEYSYSASANFEESTPPGPGNDVADVLIVSFAGSTLVVGGFPRAEFQKTLLTVSQGNNLKVDLLFVTDPSQAFYLRHPSGRWDSGDFYAANLDRISSRYSKVLAIGSSMGATAILHLAGRFTCHKAVVFNPLVDLISESRTLFWFGGLRVPLDIRRNLPSLIARQFNTHSISPTDCKLVAHISRYSKQDQQQKEVLVGRVQQRALQVVYHDASAHVLPKILQERGELVPLLRQTLRVCLCLH
jgi:hypothetical protein